ncbi:hypothetical protein [Tropicimonas sp. IMCC6043]|uniref:hypothetical protein n=1 Tax=Tropicimonas sp. IMCC6043 TaxID=2510645 RepID=UPI00101C4469|nr:hypothetical protein [Tropicimonas sp. IMCC6043]RYH10013.1 hypothetical protein EU800_10730 [Tropicimonas sp. IMCC6043]
MEHADNGAGSTLHPLTSIHKTEGDAPHFTLQAGWIQALCVRSMGLIDDSGLETIAYSTEKATKKAEVKAAQQSAYGHSIQAIDNLHFYPTGGTVGTAAPNLQTALALVQSALAKTGSTGAEINRKDDAYLAGIPQTKEGLATYQLKATEAPAWGRLAHLLNWISDGVFVREAALRRRRGAYLLDALTRASGPTQ